MRISKLSKKANLRTANNNPKSCKTKHRFVTIPAKDIHNNRSKAYNYVDF